MHHMVFPGHTFMACYGVLIVWVTAALLYHLVINQKLPR
jgi:hypothetical protein